MCFVFIWEQTATCATYSINFFVFVTEMKSVYSAVRTGSLNRAVCALSLRVKLVPVWYVVCTAPKVVKKITTDEGCVIKENRQTTITALINGNCIIRLHNTKPIKLSRESKRYYRKKWMFHWVQSLTEERKDITFHSVHKRASWYKTSICIHLSRDEELCNFRNVLIFGGLEYIWRTIYPTCNSF